jgi:peptidoglycan/xylan/chitin deacetylase (PgdA/CDA1 family)
LTAKDLGELFAGKGILPAKPVVLTFDDGYRDFYTDVFPVLKKYNAKATVYMIAGFVGYKNNLTDAQLKELAVSGLVDIGAHTVHHVGLTHGSSPMIEQEVTEGKKILEIMTGQPVVSFAYPNGEYDDVVATVVRQAGYTTAVSTKPGIETGERTDIRYFAYAPGENRRNIASIF